MREVCSQQLRFRRVRKYLVGVCCSILLAVAPAIGEEGSSGAEKPALSPQEISAVVDILSSAIEDENGSPSCPEAESLVLQEVRHQTTRAEEFTSPGNAHCFQEIETQTLYDSLDLAEQTAFEKLSRSVADMGPPSVCEAQKSLENLEALADSASALLELPSCPDFFDFEDDDLFENLCSINVDDDQNVPPRPPLGWWSPWCAPELGVPTPLAPSAVPPSQPNQGVLLNEIQRGLSEGPGAPQFDVSVRHLQQLFERAGVSSQTAESLARSVSGIHFRANLRGRVVIMFSSASWSSVRILLPSLTLRDPLFGRIVLMTDFHYNTYRADTQVRRIILDALRRNTQAYLFPDQLSAIFVDNLGDVADGAIRRVARRIEVANPEERAILQQWPEDIRLVVMEEIRGIQANLRSLAELQGELGIPRTSFVEGVESILRARTSLLAVGEALTAFEWFLTSAPNSSIVRVLGEVPPSRWGELIGAESRFGRYVIRVPSTGETFIITFQGITRVPPAVTPAPPGSPPTPSQGGRGRALWRFLNQPLSRWLPTRPVGFGPLGEPLVREVGGAIPAASLMALLRLYVTDGLRPESWHDALGTTVIPFTGVNLRRVFGGLIPERWGLYQTGNVGVTGTIGLEVASETSNLLILKGYDRLLTIAAASFLQRSGAESAARFVGRFGVGGIMSPVFAAFAGWTSFEQAGITSLATATDEQVQRACVAGVGGGALSGATLGSSVGPIGTVVGGVIGGGAVLGRAYYELNQIQASGASAVRRAGVLATINWARRGFLRADGDGADNDMIAEAQIVVADFEAIVFLGMIRDNALPIGRAITLDETKTLLGLARDNWLGTPSATDLSLYDYGVQSTPSARAWRLLGLTPGQQLRGERLRALAEQARLYREQYERFFKRGYLIRYEDGNPPVRTHQISSLNDAYVAQFGTDSDSSASQASRDARKAWIINRFPLIRDIVTNDDCMSYLHQYAPDIFASSAIEEMIVEEALIAKARLRAIEELDTPWVQDRLRELFPQFRSALYGITSLSDAELARMIRIIVGDEPNTLEARAVQHEQFVTTWNERMDNMYLFSILTHPPAPGATVQVLTLGQGRYAVPMNSGVLLIRVEGGQPLRVQARLIQYLPVDGSVGQSGGFMGFSADASLDQIFRELLNGASASGATELDLTEFFAAHPALSGVLLQAEFPGISPTNQLELQLRSYRFAPGYTLDDAYDTIMGAWNQWQAVGRGANFAEFTSTLFAELNRQIQSEPGNEVSAIALSRACFQIERN